MKFTVIHRNDQNNVGDIASNPLQYFLSPDEYQVVDINGLEKTEYEKDLPTIIGGGGLIGNDFFADGMKRVLLSSDRNELHNLWKKRWIANNRANKQLNDEFIQEYHALIKKYVKKLSEVKSAPKILWGVGHNKDLNKKDPGVEYPDWVINFDLLGIRDYDKSYPWVPCASCMHPALRKEYTIKNDIIWFEHKKQLIKDFGNHPIPRFINSGNNIEHTIELLGSANIILTNSYHGAYWGTLLKKKVIVVGAWSSKFLMMRHPPAFVDNMDRWTDAIDAAQVYSEALEECRHVTENYWQKVKELV